jgi:hypothetical protein
MGPNHIKLYICKVARKVWISLKQPGMACSIGSVFHSKNACPK